MQGDHGYDEGTIGALVQRFVKWKRAAALLALGLAAGIATLVPFLAGHSFPLPMGPHWEKAAPLLHVHDACLGICLSRDLRSMVISAAEREEDGKVIVGITLSA